MQTQTAQTARDNGIDQAVIGASSAFLAAAYDAVAQLAAEQEFFIIDDVWTMRGEWPATRDKRAMGGAMRQAKASKLIEPTDQFRPSAQINCHANPRRVWRSLVVVK